MTPPDQASLFAALDSTWPAAERIMKGPWTLRKGLGGGQRVSAATAHHAVTKDDIPEAEDGMRGIGQHPLFMIRTQDTYDAWLAERGYEIVDPVTMYIAATSTLTGHVPMTAAIPSWPPLAAQTEIWAEGGITAPRIAVMERVVAPKTSFLGRCGDAPAGAVFVAAHQSVAMVHALDVSPAYRRQGLGRTLVTAAANWAQSVRADWLALAVTTANKAACALYDSLGLQIAAHYHYRRAPGGAV